MGELIDNISNADMAHSVPHDTNWGSDQVNLLIPHFHPVEMQ